MGGVSDGEGRSVNALTVQGRHVMSKAMQETCMGRKGLELDQHHFLTQSATHLSPNPAPR